MPKKRSMRDGLTETISRVIPDLGIGALAIVAALSPDPLLSATAGGFIQSITVIKNEMMECRLRSIEAALKKIDFDKIDGMAFSDLRFIEIYSRIKSILSDSSQEDVFLSAQNVLISSLTKGNDRTKLVHYLDILESFSDNHLIVLRCVYNRAKGRTFDELRNGNPHDVAVSVAQIEEEFQGALHHAYIKALVDKLKGEGLVADAWIGKADYTPYWAVLTDFGKEFVDDIIARRVAL